MSNYLLTRTDIALLRGYAKEPQMWYTADHFVGKIMGGEKYNDFGEYPLNKFELRKIAKSLSDNGYLEVVSKKPFLPTEYRITTNGIEAIK